MTISSEPFLSMQNCMEKEEEKQKDTLGYKRNDKKSELNKFVDYYDNLK